MPNVREYRGQRGPAAKARGGLTRGRASRQMSQLDSHATRSLVSNQHKSLAMLAGQSMRRLKAKVPPGRFNSNQSELSITHEEVEENPDDAASPSETANSKTLPPPPNNDESIGFDDFTLDDLLKHVSHLMSEEGDEDSDVGGTGAPERDYSDFDIDQVDLETQMAEMRVLEEAHQERMSMALTPAQQEEVAVVDDAAPAAPQEEESEVIEVNPGEFLPFCGSKKTFDALLTGDFCVTKCFACTQDLMVTSSVDLVICSDCWIFSPVTREQRTDDGASSDSDESYSPPSSVGLGVNSGELKQWLEAV
jgi:hypothetical protein